jgi:SAM-dependent methyltransferase
MPSPRKPYCEASAQNQGPILNVLRDVFTESGIVLEIGSGTGQHAVHFARHLPHLIWQPSDLAEALPGIAAWLAEAALPNVRAPLVLDVTQQPWPVTNVNGVYSSNTAHIMAWPQVQALFRGVGEVLAAGGFFCLYGPFSYGGQHTSPSNARFDAHLKAADPRRGVRDFDDLDALAAGQGLRLFRDVAMPVNNRTLVWRTGAI